MLELWCCTQRHLRPSGSNPTEKMFKQYKMALIRSTERNWFLAHYDALCSVSALNAKSYFRKCGVPEFENIGTDNRALKLLSTMGHGYRPLVGG